MGKIDIYTINICFSNTKQLNMTLINTPTNFERLIKLLNTPNADTVDKIIELLERDGTIINIKNNKSRTPLFISCHKYDENHSIKIIQTLLKYGADPNVHDEYNDSPLIRSLRITDCVSKISVMKLLLEYGADINYKPAMYGYTFLMDACAEVKSDIDLQIINFILDNGADPNLISLIGYTALILLCERENIGNLNDIVNTFMRLVYMSRDVILQDIVKHGTALNMYLKKNHSFLDDTQLEYLSGSRTFTITKSARKK